MSLGCTNSLDASQDEMTVTEITSICSNYSAIRKIKNLCFPENKFDLPYGSTSYIINKLIKSLNLKGTKGPDGISAKLVKISGNVLDSHFANIANNDISLNKYSKRAKTTTVRPIFKKMNKNKKLSPSKSLNLFF